MEEKKQDEKREADLSKETEGGGGSSAHGDQLQALYVSMSMHVSLCVNSVVCRYPGML